MTGESGYFPANHSIRVPESDCWSLHTKIHFIGSKNNRNQQNEEPTANTNNTRQPQISLEDCARAAIDSERKSVPWKPTIGKLLESPKDSQKLLIMRHAERVDYSFPRWTDQVTEFNEDINDVAKLHRAYFSVNDFKHSYLFFAVLYRGIWL